MMDSPTTGQPRLGQESNLVLPVNISGTRLTVVVGTTRSSGDLTPIAYLGMDEDLGRLTLPLGLLPFR